MREGRADTYDGLEITVVVEVNRMAQLLPRPTYNSIDFKQQCLTTALYSFRVSVTLKNQISQSENQEVDEGFHLRSKRFTLI